MPFLDVSDVLDDPDFWQVISRQSNQVTMDATGLASQTTVTDQFQAVVVPITTRELQRLPESELLSGGVRVFSKTPLKSGQGDFTADIVIVAGVSYVVYTVDDYTAFGVGYTAATCRLLSTRGVPNDTGA